MKKLLQFAILASAMVALSLGTVGCQPKEKKDKATTDVPRVKIEVGGETHRQITVGLGEAIAESITLKRPAGVTKDLTCSVTGARDGVKGTVGAAKINGDEITVTLMIQVDNDAKLGQVPLTVVAESEGTPFASKIVPVLVRRKTSIASVKPMMIKQGQEGTAKTTVTLGDDVKEATVKLKVLDKDYKDVVGFTAKADQTKLDKTTEITMTVSVPEAAAEGDYRVEIRVEGHSITHSWSHSSSFELKVEKK